MKSLCVVIGEISGDTIGASVIAQIKEMQPDLAITGITGPALRKQGVTSLFDVERLRVMGFSQVLKKLPTIWSCLKTLEKHLLENPETTLLCIDSPSLSLRLAKRVRKRGFRGKIIQLVAPTVWAWGEKRAKVYAEYFDLLLTLYRFEPDYFTKYGLKTVWIGHPLIETVKLDGTPREKLIVLFPGSRPFEIKRNLEIQLKALKVADLDGYTIAVSVAPGISSDVILPILQKAAVTAQLIPEDKRYEFMKRATLALAKSGTVTLELALLNTPTLVTYHMNYLDYLFIKYIIRPKITLFALPNIIAGKELFPEHIYPPISFENIAHDIHKLILEGVYTLNIRDAVDSGKSPARFAAELCLQCEGG